MANEEEEIQQIWKKGKIVSNNDPEIWRKDQCDAWIKRTEYGNRESEYGWEKDHIDPDGGDDLENLRPLQWKNNVDKSEGRLKCPVTAKGVHNKEKEKPSS